MQPLTIITFIQKPSGIITGFFKELPAFLVQGKSMEEVKQNLKDLSGW